MKSLRIFSICIGLLTSISCASQQTLESYAQIKKTVVQGITRLKPDYSDFYGKPLSIFIKALKDKGLTIEQGYGGEAYQGMLYIYFDKYAESSKLIHEKRYNDLMPMLIITFKNEYNKKAANVLTLQNHGNWNQAVEDFYKDLIVEGIQ